MPDLMELWKKAARLMVGIPDYDAYVAHQVVRHPDQPVMSYEEFFRLCQERRYTGAAGGRCC